MSFVQKRLINIFFLVFLSAATITNDINSNQSDVIVEVNPVVSIPNHKQDKIQDISEVYWLALNIYHEARNQHFFGKLAVGIVTLNRVQSERYEDTIEKVVKEHKQFSWYHTKKKHAPKDMDAWKDCLRIAKMILTRSPEIDIMTHHLKSVTHYHATYVRPKWSKSYQRVIQIGDHIFYRQKK
jgi:spore germination cell wall hydrolase CwlJ-like protein